MPIVLLTQSSFFVCNETFEHGSWSYGRGSMKNARAFSYHRESLKLRVSRPCGSAGSTLNSSSRVLRRLTTYNRTKFSLRMEPCSHIQCEPSLSLASLDIKRCAPLRIHSAEIAVSHSMAMTTLCMFIFLQSSPSFALTAVTSALCCFAVFSMVSWSSRMFSTREERTIKILFSSDRHASFSSVTNSLRRSVLRAYTLRGHLTKAP
mmetsp:Transcript_3407/g.10346  ORF Transcript_3407/g.10346 Transcript_3407/m.10346 type:complete len:206 (-) Transcript_3407:626-1243(-)